MAGVSIICNYSKASHVVGIIFHTSQQCAMVLVDGVCFGLIFLHQVCDLFVFALEFIHFISGLLLPRYTAAEYRPAEVTSPRHYGYCSDAVIRLLSLATLTRDSDAS